MARDRGLASRRGEPAGARRAVPITGPGGVNGARPRVLLVGGDARTDALGAALRGGGATPEVVGVAPFASPGLLRRCATLHLVADLSDTDAILAAVGGEAFDLAVVGPEAPLAAGLVDALTARTGVACFGPTRALAAVETSKSFTRRLLERHAIAGNPRYEVFGRSGRSPDAIEHYVATLGDVVVKPDGLTGGKGVRVLGEHLADLGEAVAYARRLVEDDGLVVVEERLDGEEFSLQSVTDGETVVHLPPVQDHKRAFEGDRGPNTGGMGSYSDADLSLPFLRPADLISAREVNEAVLAALQSETGTPYRGVLYGGFIATAEGVALIEYNARFGDPEAMNVLPLLDGDWFELCRAAATGRLGALATRWRRRATVCKYVVPEGYPGPVPSGGEIDLASGPDDGDDVAGGGLFWSSVRAEPGAKVLLGSRACAAVGVGDTLEEAERRAEALVERVSGPVRHRSDIGTRALVERRVAHMAALRAR